MYFMPSKFDRMQEYGAHVHQVEWAIYSTYTVV